MSSTDVLRSERVLEKIGNRLGLTESGKQWLIAAVDPFHDVPVDCRGYPDINEAASVVQVVKFSSPINAPNGLSSTANWDCHIHNFPWEHPLSAVGGNFSSPIGNAVNQGWGTFLVGLSTTTVTPGNAGPTGFGGIGVVTCLSGQPTFDYATSGTNATLTNPFFNSIQPYLGGEYRVIAKGFEVINTTAELNLQGLCTTYRQPCASVDTAQSVTFIDATQSDNYMLGYPSLFQTNMPPISTAEALLLDGSKQWKAKEGAYVTSTLSSDELPAGLNPCGPVMKLSLTDPSRGTPPSNGYSWGVGIGNSGQTGGPFVYTPETGSVLASNSLRPVNVGVSFMQNFNHSGAYFTGLSPTTTLQLNAIYYIERFPSQQESDLVVLARHSCREDKIAMELYAQIIREMPVGVPQRMNGLGEWFADAVSSASDFIAPVLSAIPIPQAQVAAMAVKSAGGIAKAIMGKKEAPGQTYSAQGANVSASKPKSKAVVLQPKKKKKKVVTKK